jgi:hypothetical protein
VVSQEEENEDFDHSDNDQSYDHQDSGDDSSDDQVSVDRDSDDDIDGQDPDDQDFDVRESINEDSDNNDQASANVVLMAAMILNTFWTRSATFLTRTPGTAQKGIMEVLHPIKMFIVSTLLAHRLVPAIIFRRALNNLVGLLTHKLTRIWLRWRKHLRMMSSAIKR